MILSIQGVFLLPIPEPELSFKLMVNEKEHNCTITIMLHSPFIYLRIRTSGAES